MALIPMKNTIVVTPASGGYDEWGEPIPSIPVTYKCRIQEGTKLVRSISGTSGAQAVSSEETVSVAQIYLDKYVNIKPSDTLSYTDEGGTERSYKPISIERKYGLNGRCLITVVNV